MKNKVGWLELLVSNMHLESRRSHIESGYSIQSNSPSLVAVEPASVRGFLFYLVSLVTESAEWEIPWEIPSGKYRVRKTHTENVFTVGQS